MLRIAVFYACLLSAVIYAWRRGGQPEQVTASLALGAAILSTLLPFDSQSSFHSLEWGELAIDTVLLMALLVIAAYADRFWPIWFAAIQLITVFAHVARAYDPAILPLAYAAMVGQLSYPTLFILVMGTWRHQRRSLELDWSWQSSDTERR